MLATGPVYSARWAAEAEALRGQVTCLSATLERTADRLRAEEARCSGLQAALSSLQPQLAKALLLAHVTDVGQLLGAAGDAPGSEPAPPPSDAAELARLSEGLRGVGARLRASSEARAAFASLVGDVLAGDDSDEEPEGAAADVRLGLPAAAAAAMPAAADSATPSAAASQTTPRPPSPEAGATASKRAAALHLHMLDLAASLPPLPGLASGLTSHASTEGWEGDAVPQPQCALCGASGGATARTAASVGRLSLPAAASLLSPQAEGALGSLLSGGNRGGGGGGSQLLAELAQPAMVALLSALKECRALGPQGEGSGAAPLPSPSYSSSFAATPRGASEGAGATPSPPAAAAAGAGSVAVPAAFGAATAAVHRLLRVAGSSAAMAAALSSSHSSQRAVSSGASLAGAGTAAALGASAGVLASQPQQAGGIADMLLPGSQQAPSRVAGAVNAATPAPPRTLSHRGMGALPPATLNLGVAAPPSARGGPSPAGAAGFTSPSAAPTARGPAGSSQQQQQQSRAPIPASAAALRCQNRVQHLLTTLHVQASSSASETALSPRAGLGAVAAGVAAAAPLDAPGSAMGAARAVVGLAADVLALMSSIGQLQQQARGDGPRDPATAAVPGLAAGIALAQAGLHRELACTADILRRLLTKLAGDLALGINLALRKLARSAADATRQFESAVAAGKRRPGAFSPVAAASVPALPAALQEVLVGSQLQQLHWLGEQLGSAASVPAWASDRESALASPRAEASIGALSPASRLSGIPVSATSLHAAATPRHARPPLPPQLVGAAGAAGAPSQPAMSARGLASHSGSVAEADAEGAGLRPRGSFLAPYSERSRAGSVGAAAVPALPGCGRCGADFGVFSRRHHCRCCGQLVCHGCSSRKVDLAGLGVSAVADRREAETGVAAAGPVRVCESCIPVVALLE